jgi:hypothetical protein
MMWWFLILACSTGVVLWAAIAMYLRVRRHLKAEAALHDHLVDADQEREAGSF